MYIYIDKQKTNKIVIALLYELCFNLLGAIYYTPLMWLRTRLPTTTSMTNQVFYELN